jgi:hypothetical protein
MSKLWAYAMQKYEFCFWPCMGPYKFFSRGVHLIYIVANFDTYMDFPL